MRRTAYRTTSFRERARGVRAIDGASPAPALGLQAEVSSRDASRSNAERPVGARFGFGFGFGFGFDSDSDSDSDSDFDFDLRPGSNVSRRRCPASALAAPRHCDAAQQRRPIALSRQVISTHALAHARHACAHSRQCACACLSHSRAQASQMSAHSLQTSPARALRLAIAPDANRHINAQSTSSRTQAARPDASGSRRHATAHWSHARAHASHARMHASYRSFIVRSLLSDIGTDARNPRARRHASAIRLRRYGSDTVSTPFQHGPDTEGASRPEPFPPARGPHATRVAHARDAPPEK
ncbi:hypothetical protein [Burkholderia mallei]|uniref:hypothetical protein n=1 Tax=Burkholderia mallei TaxID=13373 RepID=UPI0002EED54F|nr:hypothetical protein [Burkholderia mallei]